MQREGNNKIVVVLCWSLVVVCMGVIFWLSARSAKESAMQSSILLDWIRSVFGDGAVTDFIVRKCAHLLEFTGLCFLFNIALYFTKNKPCVFLSVLFTSLYAVTDELHQHFVPGRSCELRDWAIDSAGAILGTIMFAVFLLVFSQFKKNRAKKILTL